MTSYRNGLVPPALRSRRALALVAILSVFAATMIATGPATVAAAASSAAKPVSRVIHQKGTATYTPVATGSGDLASLSTEIPRTPGPDGNAPAGSSKTGPARSRS